MFTKKLILINTLLTQSKHKINNFPLGNFCKLKSTEVENASKASRDQQVGNTIFAKIVSKQIPAKIIFENDNILAFEDNNPQAPVHYLVIPKQPIPAIDSVEDKHKELLGELLICAQKLAKERCPKGFRLVINNGKEGCQSVYHLHIHVIGGRQMKWPPG